MGESNRQTLERLRRELPVRRKQQARLRGRLIGVRRRIRRLLSGIRKRTARPGPWHPDAVRVLYADAGAFVVAAPKLVWHTTEGTSLPSYSGSAPHFTFDPATGRLWQHIPVDRAARALAHTRWPETNRANAIQVELIGFANDTATWPREHYERIARLARWIEAAAGVPRVCGVTFRRGVARLDGQGWLDYAGHCGHQHVPQNDHYDPGSFRIAAILGGETR